MSKPRTIRLSPEDNVVVAVDQIAVGANVAGVTARERVPRGITCDNKKRCEHEFAKGTATEHFREFCPNAVSIDELVDQKGQLSSH